MINLKHDITIAVSKGRISRRRPNSFKKLEIEISEDIKNSRKLIYPTNCEKLKLVIVRASDVPTYVANGAADFGIVGKDTRL